MLSDEFIIKVSPFIYRIGSLGVPIYLLDTPKPVIIDAGYSIAGSFYANAIRKILGHRQPELCLITHAHFDHVGSLGFLKTEFPSLKALASSRSKEISAKPKSMDHIAGLNNFAAELETEMLAPDKSPFLPFEIDEIISDGDRIALGNSIFVDVIETHGHTRDSLCFNIDSEKVLFTGDSGGIMHDSGYLFFDFLSGCAPYLKSLETICSTNARIICPGHYNVIMDKLAESYLKNLVPACLKFIDLVSAVLDDQNFDLGKTMQIIKSLEYDVLNHPKQPEPAYLLNLEARVGSVSSFMSLP